LYRRAANESFFGRLFPSSVTWWLSIDAQAIYNLYPIKPDGLVYLHTNDLKTPLIAAMLLVKAVLVNEVN
jgi:hypothetical protein